MRVYSTEFRLEVVHRVLNGEKVGDLALELGIHRKLIYEWVRRVTDGGEANLRSRGRPRKVEALPDESQPGLTVTTTAAELERMVGRQQMIIEFFKLALRRIEELRRSNTEPGGTASLEPLWN